MGLRHDRSDSGLRSAIHAIIPVRESVADQNQDRRQYGRIDLDRPLKGFLDEFPVRVIEVSVSGLRVEHDLRIVPAPTRKIRVEVSGRTLEFGCVVARSTLFRLAKEVSEKSIYHSGIRILESVGDSEMRLREFIADRVTRALDEQKANSRGLPPLGPYTFQVGKGDRFKRCEFIDGAWRKTDSTTSLQPANGFTVSAEIDPATIDLLCRTFEQTTEEGRRLTQMLAELSIKKTEGGPTRRYVP
jgi:hypothetical protein